MMRETTENESGIIFLPKVRKSTTTRMGQTNKGSIWWVDLMPGHQVSPITAKQYNDIYIFLKMFGVLRCSARIMIHIRSFTCVYVEENPLVPASGSRYRDMRHVK